MPPPLRGNCIYIIHLWAYIKISFIPSFRLLSKLLKLEMLILPLHMVWEHAGIFRSYFHALTFRFRFRTIKYTVPQYQGKKTSPIFRIFIVVVFIFIYFYAYVYIDVIIYESIYRLATHAPKLVEISTQCAHDGHILSACLYLKPVDWPITKHLLSQAFLADGLYKFKLI